MLSIRKTFVIVFVMLVAIPLSLLWAWPHAHAIQSELNEIRERQLLLARSLSLSLEGNARDVIAAFSMISEELVAGTDGANVQRHLRNFRFMHACTIDISSGRVLHAFAGRRSPPAQPPSAQTVTVLAGLPDGDSPQVLSIDTPDDGRLEVVLAVRVGQRAVLGTVDASRLSERISASVLGHGAQAMLLDRSGRVLAMSSGGRAMERDAVPRGAVLADFFEGRVSYQTYALPQSGEHMVAAFHPVSAADWGVLVQQPVAEITTRTNRARTVTVSLIAAGILAAALVALRLGLSIAVPLRKIMCGVREIELGDTSVRIPVSDRTVPSEIRALEQAFNSMAESIDQARASECEARSRAEKANRAKTDFLRYVTHELRSPTSAIIGFSELLANERHGPIGVPAYREHVRDILAASRHVLSLVNDLLDLSRIEAGQYQIEAEAMGLDELVERCFRYLRPNAVERSMTLEASWPGEAPVLMVDERAMFQVLLNLSSNAVRYGFDGGKIAIKAKPLADGGLEIVVEDNGPGIPAADLKRVMEPFQRVESARNRGVKGTGLGLPIVKRLVELHQGTFQLESTLGIGTTARIVLPAERIVVEKEPRHSSAGPVALAAAKVPVAA